MTNIYNAIQNLYNMDKETWQEVLSEMYTLVNNTSLKFDTFEQKFLLHLGNEVTKELKKMYDDGRLGDLINDVLLKDINTKIDNNYTTLDNKIDTVNSELNSQLDNIATQTNVLNDTLITSLKNNGKVLLTSTVESSAPLTLSKDDLTIDGMGYSIKTTTNGQNFIFIFENCNNLEIKNIKFDSNLKGRSILKFINCNNVKVHNCFFTGYTLDYGYYKTDSAVLIENCNNVFVDCCIFNDFGYSLSNSLEELVRCITIQGNCNNIKINENTFDKINQGIVCTSGNIFIEKNYFDNVKDNNLYLFDGKYYINNNYFSNKNDECIVVKGGYYNINNNTFEDIPNKVVAINGNTELINIKDNTFIQNITTGAIISSRELKYLVTTLNFENNYISTLKYTFIDDILRIGDVKNININNNKFYCNLFEYQKLIRITAPSMISGSYENNLINNNGDYRGLFIFFENVNDENIIKFNFKNNKPINCRSELYSFISYEDVNLNNLSYITNPNKSRTFYSNALPTKGIFKPGDIILKTTPSSIHGWTCITGGKAETDTLKWKELLTTNYRSREGTPINWIAPLYVGEIVFDSVNSKFYIGTEVGSATGWKLITT